MINLTEPGADWLQPVGTDCTACDGSQKQQQSLRSKILTLNEAITSFNKRKRGYYGCLGVQKALFFAKCIEGIKVELTTYEANLEKRVFEELFSPDFFEILRDAKWLKDQKLEKVLFKMKNIALVTFDIPEEVDGHQTRTTADIYQWIEQNIGEMRSLLKKIKKLNRTIPPESFAAVYEKQSTKIDMESVEDFYYDIIMNVGKLTFRKLQAFRTRAVAEFINTGVLKHAYKPTTEEVAEVDFKRVKRELPSDFKFKRFFRRYCAVFKKMSRWEGLCLIIDIEDYGKYICLHMSKMTADELLEFFRIEKLLTLINKAIMNLPKEELQEALEKQGKWMEESRKRSVNLSCASKQILIENNFKGNINNLTING